MADLATINIEVVYDSTPMDKMIKSGDAAEAMVKRLNKAYVDGKITMDEAMRGLQEIDVYQRKNSVSTQDAIKLQKELDRVNKINNANRQAAAAEEDRLKTKYDASYTAMKKYREELNDLNSALDMGVLNSQQYATATEDLSKNFADGTGIFEEYSQQLGDNSSKIGLVLQQAGYQIGDFLVQIQSGTNIFVAFGQQASQMVGLISIFSAEIAVAFGVTQMAVAGFTLGLSILIPVITLVGASLTRGSEDTEKAKIALDNLNNSLKSIDNTLKSWVQTKKAASMGITVDELLGITGIDEAKKSLEDAQMALIALNESQGANNLSEGGLGVALGDLIFGSKEESDLAAAEKAVTDATKRLADIQTKLSEEQKAAFDEQYASLMQNYAMEKTIAQFGSDSAEVKKLELRQALDDYNRQIDAQIKSNEISAGQGDLLKQINKVGQEAVVKAEEAAKAEAKKAEVIQDAADKSTYLKNVFHAMAGEAGAVSVELGSWAGAIIDATNASSGLKDFLLKMRIDTGMKGRGLPADYYGMDTAPVDTGKLFGNIDFGPTGASIKPEKEKKASAGPSVDTLENKLQELYKYLDAQKQIEAYMIADEEIAYQQREDLLKSALDKKLITLQDYQTMERDLTARHQEELANIESTRQTTQIKDAGTFFGGMADLAKAGGDKTAKAVRIFSAAQALTNSYLAFTQILADPSLVGRPWARFGMAASALASGLSAVAAIRSGGGGGISGGGSGSGKNPASVETSSSAQTASPQVVMIQGLKPTDVFTGEQLSTLFDSLYKENRNRGMVFQVAR